MFEIRRLASHVAEAVVAFAIVAASHAFADPASAVVDVETTRAAANQALAEGRFGAARELYGRLLASDPEDAQGLREAGRAAHAMRDFDAAAKLLARAAAVATATDPELHYLRGEALWALGREADARTAYARARREIGDAPTERLPRLWLAQIDGRLGDRAAADAIYDAMAKAAPADAEIALAHAAMHAAVHDWQAAERAIRRLLAVVPTNRSAREMLAWIDEARGEIANELEVREQLAKDSKLAGPVRDYGRALERSGDWAAALATYRLSSELEGGATDRDLGNALRRMDQRMAIEVAAGAVAKTDPGADSIGASAGVAVPFGRAHNLAFGAWQERVSKAGREGSAGELSAAVAIRGVTSSAIAGAKLGVIEFSEGAGMPAHSSTAPSAFGQARTSVLGGHVELGLDGEINAVWRETPTAELEGGRIDSATAHLWGNGFSRALVIDTGAQVRRLQLMEEAAGEPVASQLFAWGGVDWALWRDYSKQAAGEILDESLLRSTYLANAVTASYRHYAVFSTWNMAFGQRLGMTDHAAIDEASLSLRRAVLDGRFALDVRAGLGYDWTRELWIEAGAGSLWIATGARSRLTLSLELAKETARPIPGERVFGGMTFHVDL